MYRVEEKYNIISPDRTKHMSTVVKMKKNDTKTLNHTCDILEEKSIRCVLSILIHLYSIFTRAICPDCKYLPRLSERLALPFIIGAPLNTSVP